MKKAILLILFGTCFVLVGCSNSYTTERRMCQIETITQPKINQ